MNKKDLDAYRVKPGQKIDLAEWDPDDKRFFKGKKKDVQVLMTELNYQLEAQQELLYAEHKHKLLIVLQAMDTGGKDGTIRHVFEGVNPQGVKVAGFKVPTPLELDHDYLWRVHKQTPGKGEIVIFNRSHYEDVLVVRVHGLVAEKTWKRRFDHINAFEKMLAEEGTTILKFYLHINLEEQKQRFLSRVETPHKQWKFSFKDLEERKLWPEYMKAYEDVLSKTSTDWAPWYIVPANRKWYRNLVISAVVIDTLKGLKMKYPQAEGDLDKVAID
jgi:PPK2 family polyphosphate:nucleotide phosphotransferase